mmetsp:Transcript_20015/g.49746  ORF Transcript_20015/g.49746 Transcript_20015/m.49746 type:complete len:307 (-) Transcript_20015:260-1180(-)
MFLVRAWRLGHAHHPPAGDDNANTHPTSSLYFTPRLPPTAPTPRLHPQHCLGVATPPPTVAVRHAAAARSKLPPHSRGRLALHRLPLAVVAGYGGIYGALEVADDGIVDEVHGFVQPRDHGHHVVDVRRQIHRETAQHPAPSLGRHARGLERAVHGQPHLAVHAELVGQAHDVEVLAAEVQAILLRLQPERAKHGGSELEKGKRQQLHLPRRGVQLLAAVNVRECDVNDALAVADVLGEGVRVVLVFDSERHGLAALPRLSHVGHDEQTATAVPLSRVRTAPARCPRRHRRRRLLTECDTSRARQK